MKERCKLDNLKFSPEFFQDEVREGFYISTMMKRYWASQLRVLSSIARICDAHGIKWFADCGTLLGAVRHEGYIPWDDDLDICMLRSDWLRFFEVAGNELPEGYQVLTIQGNAEYDQIIGRVVNSSAIDYGKEHLEEYYGCPYTVGIDVFPLDGVYDDEEQEASWRKRTKRVLDALDEVTLRGKRYSDIRGELGRIERENDVSIDKGKDLERQLLVIAEKLYSECSLDDSEHVALMPFYATKGHHKYPKELFNDVVKLPFENTYINVPGRYEEVLWIEYRDFMHVVKGGGIHDYPVYIEQEKMLGEALGHKPYDYSMNYNELLASVQRYVMRLAGAVGQAGAGRSGAGAPDAGQLDAERLGTRVAGRKVVAMLPCRAKWWSSMEPLWNYYKEHSGEYEVHVLPIFWFDCDFAGNVGEKHDERDLFPAKLEAEPCEKFDFAGIHPDIIVMQVPFDGFNTSMTVHEFFYSSNLKQFTDELVYVPCFSTYDPGEDDAKAVTAIRMLVEQPAVVNADRVVVCSDRIREIYLQRALELSGAETEMYWKQKIVTVNEYSGNQEEVESIAGGQVTTPEWDELLSNKPAGKVIVYYISISFILKGREKAIDKISRSLDIFAEAGDDIIAIVEPQEAILNQLVTIDTDLGSRFTDVLYKAAGIANVIVDRGGIAINHMDKWSAFYGDRGSLALKCIEAGIPVMIENMDV